MLRLNGQKQCNPTPNLKNKHIDIETDLEEVANISQQINRTLKVRNNTIF